jgi:hypothetical protein
VGTLFYLYQALGMSAWVDMHQDQVKAGPCTTKDSELPQTQVTHCNMSVVPAHVSRHDEWCGAQ